MGKKLEAVAQHGEPEETLDFHTKKNKKSELENEEANILKRKLEKVENEIVESNKKRRRRRKKNIKKNSEESVGVLEEEGKKEKKQESENNGKEVFVSGNNINESKYKALSSFEEAKLPDEVLQCCKSFSKPSPIQSHAWPYLLDGRDFIGIAATGSGKTLAFGIPALMHIRHSVNQKTTRRVNPLCLVLSPTRELAQQIADVLYKAGKSCGARSVCLYGGTSKKPQISALKAGVDIVIGTPGRLKDLMRMGCCRLQEVSYVVLDEADRMLDMGFEPQVRSILSQTCSVRQLVMFSATWPPSVHQLAQEFMDPNPVKIVEVLDNRARDARLIALLEKYHQSQKNRVLVFVLFKKEAARVENMLQRSFKAVSVHGDKDQRDRTKVLGLFKKGTCPLMVATDVAARGLDIPDVEVVINYSFPRTTEDYVHRIGRTGRAGKKGIAHTFFTQQNKGLAGKLVNVLREAGQIVPTDLTKLELM
ncbi:hypothetical protein AQUCO_00500600v1 [Aquilegia coerulea]|uniref:RNA helicase n=1 Tax=Aquilegia coerulea TaxID=218851 RepID=A0A2G5ESZ1_AQUCA|nr:hypothetical protein AQUCO_00500600v1 [Aquilegia coerulea]